jgi:hypothetical protein
MASWSSPGARDPCYWRQVHPAESDTYLTAAKRSIAQSERVKYMNTKGFYAYRQAGYEPGGREFESLRAHQFIKHLCGRVFDDPCYSTALCYWISRGD